MKLQVAIDRVSLEQAKQFVGRIDGVDIIEIGTSLTKDFGLDCLRKTRALAKSSKILADIKTMDEGEYEFRNYYEAGADILTVMGAADPETIDICCKIAKEYNKEVMIDLLGCDKNKIKQISHYDEAIYAIHVSKDSDKATSLVEETQHFKEVFPHVKRIAVAGGLDLEKVKTLVLSEIEIVIVGSSILKKETIENEIKKYLEVIR